MVDAYEFLEALSSACDMVADATMSLHGHGKKVAYTAVKLGQIMCLPTSDMILLAGSALLHDVGVSSTQKFLEIRERKNLHEHCHYGARLLSEIDGFRTMAEIVQIHHAPASVLNPTEQNHVIANIIHLADEVAVNMPDSSYPLWSRNSVLEIVECRHTWFMPSILDAFRIVALQEAFWLELGSKEQPVFLKRLFSKIGFNRKSFPDTVDIVRIALVLSKIIDVKSHFTVAHSIGVTNVAVELGMVFGYGKAQLRRLSVAGLVHDLGKLTVPDDILNKPGPLDEKEMLVMKQHTFHTRRILTCLRGFNDIAQWAANHHERLDGAGYPFKYGRRELDLGSRIVAVADTFQALNQDRPYREAMPKTQVLDIINSMATNGALDSRICKHLTENFNLFKDLALEQNLVRSLQPQNV